MTTPSRIIGMGETVMDILFRETSDSSGRPTGEFSPFAAVPGGSSFNSMISVGRSGVPSLFIGYTGSNRVGRQIATFLQENGISTDFFEMRECENASLSLAYLNSQGDADYTFYKETPRASASFSIPHFTYRDYLLFGSYFAVCQGLRPQVSSTLKAARQADAVIYYDINIRRSHQHELPLLWDNIKENARLSSIVRGSADDFVIIYGTSHPEEIYEKYISPLCPIFICTSGAGRISICTPSRVLDFSVPPIPRDEIVSTVGAGDSFNAGFLCEMHNQGISHADLSALSEQVWQSLVARGVQYASQVCRSQDNYIKKSM